MYFKYGMFVIGLMVEVTKSHLLVPKTFTSDQIIGPKTACTLTVLPSDYRRYVISIPRNFCVVYFKMFANDVLVESEGKSMSQPLP